MFASVSLEGTRHGVVTDVSGFYSISKVPEGEYNLIVSSIEYENYKESGLGDPGGSPVDLEDDVVRLPDVFTPIALMAMRFRPNTIF